MAKKTVYIRETVDYKIEVEVPNNTTPGEFGARVAKLARESFLADVRNAEITGVYERSFEVDGEVFTDEELA